MTATDPAGRRSLGPLEHAWQVLTGPAVATPAGEARIVSRVDAWVLGPFTAWQHRPIRVELSGRDEGASVPVRDPGFGIGLTSNLLSILGRKR